MTNLNSMIATTATMIQPIALRASEPNADELPMRRTLVRRAQAVLIVRALQVREALGARDLAVLEREAGEPVAAHGGVGAAVRRHEGETSHRKTGRRQGRA